MKHERQRRTPNHYLWSRILERHRCRRGLFRPRVPLVLRRHGVPARAGVTRGNVRPAVSHYQFALHLHLHLSSLWWPPGSARHLAPQESARHHTVLRTLLEHAGQAAGRPMRTSGSAPRGRDVTRSWSKTPSSHGPSVRALSSHTLSACTKSAPTLSARAMPSTTPSSNATRTASNGTSALLSEPRHVSLQRISSPSLWYARSGRAGGSRAPKAPDRVTCHALTRPVLAKTLVQRHPQHVANTSDASHEAVRLAPEVIAPEGIRRPKAITVAERNGRTWTHPAVTLVQRHPQHVANPFNAPHEAVCLAPEVIRRPKAITVAERNGRTWAHPAMTLMQRHPQHVANTFNAPHQAVRLAPEVIAPEGIRRPKAITVGERNGRTWAHPAVTLVQRDRQHVASTFNASREAVRLAPEVIAPEVIRRPKALTVAERNGRTWAHPAVSAPFHPVLMTAPGSSWRPVQRRGEGRPSVVEGMRSPLYAQPAARSFANHPAATTAQQAPAPERRTAPPPPAHVQALQPQIDLGRLSEDVYQHIQRKIRIERERRGL